MNYNKKWIFPKTDGGQENGFDNTDVEHFNESPIKSLAREIVQNSIDAMDKNLNKKVRIEFKLFDLKCEDIPGYSEMVDNLQYCIDYWEEMDIPKTVKSLKEIKSQLEKPVITCLRISDFNTTGLTGIYSKRNSAWFKLLRGSGISGSNDERGGSKGIGKFATFTNSILRTVFYSTSNNEGQCGYQGVLRLCSARIPDTNKITTGIGYFGRYIDEGIQAHEGQLMLDSSFSRSNGECGTDIYILGFKKENDWKENVALRILDSFMGAIVKDLIEVEIDDIKINSETIESIVYNKDIVNKKKDKASIISQYMLFTDKENVHEEVITIEDMGEVHLYLKLFKKEEADIAINKCIMIRYPYMKILEKPVSVLSKISAMCVIPYNEFGKALRNIENAQHTSWGLERLPIDERTILKTRLDKLYKDIKMIIEEFINQGSKDETPIEGSEDFLSKEDIEKAEKEAEKRRMKEKGVATKPVKAKDKNTNKNNPNPDGDGDKLSQVISEETGDILISDNPEENGGGGGHGPRPKPEEKPGKEDPEGKFDFIKENLSNMQFKFFCLDKSAAKYAITFTSVYDIKNAHVVITPMDESNGVVEIKIFNVTVNNVKTLINDNNEVIIDLVKGAKYKIQFNVDQNEYFACGVKAYAYKK